jgi:predicted nucleic acid-binding protein
MYLVDTNLWIQHFRSQSSPLAQHLLNGEVMTHELIIGELSLGSFRKSNRKVILSRLHALERLPSASYQEILDFVETKKLYSAGIGWVDVCLLYACWIHKVRLLTEDKAMKRLAHQLGI